MPTTIVDGNNDGYADEGDFLRIFNNTVKILFHLFFNLL